MENVIEILQREALDPAFSLTTLLRKALVIASKLELHIATAWITKELNG